MGDQRLWVRLVLAGLLASALVLGGCSGDDGRDGITIEGKSAYELAVDNGFVGTEAEWLASLRGTDGTDGDPAPATPVTALESCTLCHKDGGFSDPVAEHAIEGLVNFDVNSVTTTATTVVIDVDIDVDGTPMDTFTNKVAVASYTLGTTAVTNAQGFTSENAYTSTTAIRDATAVVANGGGNYTITITPPATFPSADNVWTSATDTTWMIRLNTGTTYPEANIVAHQTTSGEHVRNLTSNTACINCHGDHIFTTSSRIYHNTTYGVGSCVTCHTSMSRDNLARYVHGIHNAHNMPAGGYDRNGDGIIDFDTTYPTYMQNCSVCHDTADGLAAAKDAPTSFGLCMSCHGDWTGFSFSSTTAAPFKDYHATLVVTTDCVDCHKTGGAAPNKVVVSDYHNGLQTERSGVIWDGKDLSVVEGAKVDMQITGVSYPTATTLAVTWTAAYDGAPVNPCNAVAAAGAPAFHAAVADAATGQVASNMSLLRAYGQGDDWVNAGIGTAPGQPVATNLSTTNTQCAANVATTTIDLTAGELATTATKGIVALQGKAQVDLGVDYLPAAGVQSVDQVRSKTPTRQFVVGTGALDTTRRAIVDTDACLKCHVGSLYQHGGNRVDNVDMCVMCHNEASSEQNVRVADGVDASEAYDGKPGMTYGFKSLLHGVHAAGKTGDIVMCYRTNGIYVWTGADTVIPNWPGTGAQTVYGSNPAGTNPDGTTRVHNLHIPTYPRAINDCQACHFAGTTGVPDQAKSVATTVDAGAAPWGNQLDDKLMGTGAATCVSCHTGAQAKAHASQNGWAPTTFPNGRQTIIDAAN